MTYTILSRTNRWQCRGDRYYRECIALRSDGQHRLIAVPDAIADRDVVRGAA